ncbi:MarR family winged helix-turn-helix transcriptional regulator [Nocardiopsis sp. CNT312]|uniref:MarR family winged helix-turn-helix transcriptional regulator n=1 Tax=Nocardiopsis sp. CNT312 TaxID=1137268 RepID=UPI000491CB59|nr:MarR family transcriptional regulator [Nocardiopsis sp. CNT312]
MADGQRDEHLALENQLCFSLYAASRALTGLYRDLLDDLGLTYPQYLVLLALWERDALTVKELGRALRLDSGTLSPLLRRLERAGLLDRRRSAADERVVEVTLTEEGERMRSRVWAVPGRVLHAAGLDPQQAGELRRALDRLTASVGSAPRGGRSHSGPGGP